MSKAWEFPGLIDSLFHNPFACGEHKLKLKHWLVSSIEFNERAISEIIFYSKHCKNDLIETPTFSMIQLFNKIRNENESGLILFGVFVFQMSLFMV